MSGLPRIRDKNIKGLLERAVAQGFVVEGSEGKSQRVTVYRDGERVATTGSAPTSYVAYRELRARLRRAGYVGD